MGAIPASSPRNVAPNVYNDLVINESQALMTGSALGQAARFLALAEGRLDGWCRAEEVAALAPKAVAEAEQVDRWVRRLEVLVHQHPEVHVLIDGTEGYPKNLGSVEGRPAVLFVDGLILPDDARALAVVGSRQADLTVIKAASGLASRLAHAGYTVVSGLARGVDTASHKGALAAGGRTIAVVGTGIDQMFPPENGGLVQRIRRSGAVVSQFPPGHGPTKTSFPARNSVIAGLSRGSIVVTANERSGTRIEIDRTLAQGRPVFLWQPFLGDQPWAWRLAEHPHVHMVTSVDDIEDVLTVTPMA